MTAVDYLQFAHSVETLDEKKPQRKHPEDQTQIMSPGKASPERGHVVGTTMA